jgi:hypothetical protein
MSHLESATFATVVIHTSHAGQPLVLKASVSFPAVPYRIQDKDKPLPPSWNAKDSSSAEGHLELRLFERLGEGRISTVYSATVLSARQGGGIDITSSLPQKLCLKFAKKEFCRSLARDAWFYEQLHHLQGVAIARSYGFYGSTVKEQGENQVAANFEGHFGPWQDYKHIPRYISDVAEWSSSMDWLPDDEIHNPPRYICRSRLRTQVSFTLERVELGSRKSVDCSACHGAAGHLL